METQALVMPTVGVLSALGLVCCTVRQKQLEAASSKSDRAVWCRPEDAKGTPRLPLAQQMAMIVERCEELRSPRYVPPLWAAGSYANVTLFMAKDRLAAWRGLGPCLEHEVLDLPDGGVISIDYSDDAATRALPADAPVVMVLHTITGSGPSTRWFLRDAARRGWRGCVLNRRGAVEPLRSPRFNLLGDVEDTRLQVEAVRRRYPEAFLAMVGISAGSGLLVSYLGTCRADTPVRLACSLCPAYDISTAFENLHTRHGMADRYLLKHLKRRFINENLEVLEAYNSEAVKSCLDARSLHEFMLAHVPFTGAASEDEYFAESNPMSHVEGLSVPLLLLNSEDDMVCLPENIREDIPADHGGGILVRTSRGSHCAYCEGWAGAGSYLCRLTLDFLDAGLAVGAHAVDVSAGVGRLPSQLKN